MRNYKYLLLVSTCLLFNNNSQASELDLTFNSTTSSFGIYTSDTHTPVELKPISNLKSIKLAAVCALGSGGCDGLGFGSGNNNIDLDESAQCRDEGFVTSCPSGYVPDASQKCPYNNSFFKCRICSHTCNSGALTTCNSDQVQTGTIKNDCNETCYSCRAKTCEEGGYSSSITSCQKASNITFAGKTCYSGVSSKTCGDGGYVSSIPTNQVGQSTNFCSNTCYYNLRTPACSEGGYRDNIPVNQVCATTPYYGQTCYSGCYTPTCSAGGYVSSCPANQIGTSVNYYGQNCYSGCNQPQCSAGGYVDACPANQIGSGVSYYGRTCYSGCYQPQCSAGGYVASIPAGKECTSVSYYGRTCYKDCKDSCTKQGVAMFMFIDMKNCVYSVYINGTSLDLSEKHSYNDPSLGNSPGYSSGYFQVKACDKIAIGYNSSCQTCSKYPYTSGHSGYCEWKPAPPSGTEVFIHELLETGSGIPPPKPVTFW